MNSQLAAAAATDADWLVGGGQMAEYIKTKDWSDTQLGPIESWPQSLRTVVSLAQASNSPISLAWGTGHCQIYNDGYWPICGDKHPVSMGQDFSECWASAFPVIGDAYRAAWSGKPGYLEKMRMFLDRYGFPEETCFTFSFSPITDESGKIGGLFHWVTELTSQMLSERRTNTLRDLAVKAAKAQRPEEVCAIAAEILSGEEAQRDTPFALLYFVDSAHQTARLVAHTPMPESLRPQSVDICGANSEADFPWPLNAVATTGETLEIVDTKQRLGGLALGPYDEPPTTAFVLPIMSPGRRRPTAILVVGASSRLQIDEPYRTYFALLTASIGSSLASARAYEQEKQRAEALAEIDAAKTTFFSNVSHEFRTPLTLILGPVEDALMSPERALTGDSLLAVHRSSIRLLRLVNSLLDFARIGAGRLHMRYEPTDVALLTADLASSFRSLIERAGVELFVDCESLGEPVYVDPVQWEKIVLNLVSNAFKFTLHGSIGVSVREVGDYFELIVADTGTGIPADEVDLIFERFHRVEGATGRSFEGTGIGLSMVQELSRLHGGDVSVVSHPGVGTTMTVRIPTGKQHLPLDQVVEHHSEVSTAETSAPYLLEASQWLGDSVAVAPRPVPPPQVSVVNQTADGAQSTRIGARARIVAADDNADMRGYLFRLLSPRWDVEVVADGQAALEAARRIRPDIVLTDVMMPRLDGVALLRELRADPGLSDVPVIMLSARAGEEAIIEGLATGADDYLSKPFSARELLARVNTHLDMARLRRRSADRLLDAYNELESFSYSVSHDLHAPLRTIDAFSEILLEDYADKIDAEGREHLELVRTSAQRMGLLIDDLLQLARITQTGPKREVVDLSELARSTLKELMLTSPNRHVGINIPGGVSVAADPRLMAAVFANLIGNAWKFTGKTADAIIEFGVETVDGEAVYFVADNGAGFEMDYASRLFTPFRRLHSDGEFEGTGIGLAIAAKIISRHGGRIWAEAEPDRGATFYFTVGSTDC